MNPRVELYRSQVGKAIEFDYPILRYLDYTILDAADGYLKVEMQARKELLNPSGLVHGGVMAMLMDEMLGAAAWTLNRPKTYISINLNIDFLSGARVDDLLIAEGFILRPGKNVLHGEAKVFNSGGKLLCKASSNLISVD